MGKGSSQRPTDKAAFDSGYERIFGKPEYKTYGQPMGTVNGENWHPVELPTEARRQMNSRIRAMAEAIIRGTGMTQAMQDGSARTVDPYPEFTGKITTPNQTCGNCKHWSRHHDHHPARCANIDLVDMIDTDGGYWGFESPADFSCSLWKAKP